MVAGAGLGGVCALGQIPQTVPPAFDAVAGSLPNSLPIGNYSAGVHQVLYGADQMAAIPVGSFITGMQLRLSKTFSATFPTSALSITRYDITFASSALTPATMSATFANNMSGALQVRSGSFNLASGAYQWINNGAGVPQPWGPVIPFSTPYVYLGGPLVIQMRVVSPSNNFNAYADIGNTPSARYMYQDNNADAATAVTVPPTNGGLVVRLTFVPPAPDLAKGVTKVIVGEKYAGTSANSGDGVLIWASQFTQQAVAAASQFDTIGPSSDFVGVSTRLEATSGAAWPTATRNFADYNVQLSRSQNGPGTLSTTIASNVGADAVTVRSGALSIPIGNFGIKGTEATSPFAPELSFANAYQYRGGPLLMVTRHSGFGSGTVGFLDSLSSGHPDAGVDVRAYQVNNSGAAVAAGSSGYAIARFSVDAGTGSPLSLPGPIGGAGAALQLSQSYQTILSASELKYIPVGSVIDSLWLRQVTSASAAPANSLATADFELAVSTAANRPDSMSLTFAANEGADRLLVHDGPLAVTAGRFPAGSNGNYGKLVQFQKNFVYKGGDLCLTIRHAGGLGTALGGFEAVTGTASTNRSTYAFAVGAPTGAFFNLGYTGTATKLGYIPSVMTPNRLATTNGSGTWELPVAGNYAVQTIIRADQLRSVDVGSAITGMSFRAAGGNASAFPATDVNLSRFDVSIAPAARTPLTMSATFATNIGVGAVQVRSGPMTVPAGAYPVGSAPQQNAWYIPFSRAYVYTGGDLCVTFRGVGTLTNSFLLLDGDSTLPIATGASVYEYSNANAISGNLWGPLGIRLAFTARAFCPWDLNNDGIVSDDDFPIFLSGYNTLDCTDAGMAQGCPADFNYDRVVDDLDFNAFIGAYNDLVCP